MARNIELLLLENVENLGIVGDIKKVRLGYARNFLLPRALATTPSEELLKSLQAKRADAERLMAEVRNARAATISKLAGYELTLERSCNDQGILYGAVTQQEIAAALRAAGYDVRPRDVRIHDTIKRIDTYEVHIKYEAELETKIKLWIVPDRKLDSEEKPEMDFDMEGNLIEPGRKGRKGGGGRDRDRDRDRAEPATDAAAAPEDAKADKHAEKHDKPAKTDKHEKAAKHEKSDAHEKGDKGDKKAVKSTSPWGDAGKSGPPVPSKNPEKAVDPHEKKKSKKK